VAALTAGLFGSRQGRSTLVLVADIPGGHLANIDKIEDFPGFPEGIAGYELGPKMQEQAANAGAEFRMAEAQRIVPLPPVLCGRRAERLGARPETTPRRPGGVPFESLLSVANLATVVDPVAADGFSAVPLGEGASTPEWRIVTSDGDVTARSAIIATGSHPRKLGLPGENRFEGRGLSHCASCDGPLLRGGPAVVVGGGDSAFMEALTLAEYASEVTIVHNSHAASAQNAYQRRVSEHPKITIRAGATVDELLGDETLTGVRVGQETLPAAGVWVYIGLEPNTAWLQDALRLTESRHIPTDVWLQTELPGVFAAGDVRANSASQAITAAGDGATAAIAAHRYLHTVPSPAAAGASQ
ncbi:MAG: FAD-dependent oxidoreductase, partial [Chloroflexota bacterium]